MLKPTGWDIFFAMPFVIVALFFIFSLGFLFWIAPLPLKSIFIMLPWLFFSINHFTKKMEQ